MKCCNYGDKSEIDVYEYASEINFDAYVYEINIHVIPISYAKQYSLTPLFNELLNKE